MRSSPSLVFAFAALASLSQGCAPETPPLIDGTAAPIVGGNVDETTKGVVGLAIGIPGIFFSGHCTGTLIAPNLVLTARHCIAQQGGGQQQGVICGQNNFNNAGGGSLFFATTLAVRPNEQTEDFYQGTAEITVPEGGDICGNDVALLQLAGAGVPAEVATPIVPRIDLPPEEGEVYSAVGYGLTDPNGQRSGGTRMRLDDNEVDCPPGECGAGITETEWVGNSRTCPGDSGGPAIDAQGRVIGVLSRGPQGCLSSAYGNVSSWKDMIIERATRAAEEGGYEPPFWVTTGSSTKPEPDPVGVSCSAENPCPKGWKCQATSAEGGVCIAPCSAAAPTCASGVTCNLEVEACVDPSLNPPAPRANSSDSGSCSLRSQSGPVRPVPWVVAGLVAIGLTTRRRRRA